MHEEFKLRQEQSQSDSEQEIWTHLVASAFAVCLSEEIQLKYIHYIYMIFAQRLKTQLIYRSIKRSDAANPWHK